MNNTIRIGTRRSKLALWQANHVADLLRAQISNISIEFVVFTTQGDKILDKSLPSIGGKGLFTEELEQALLKGDIDCAVHSLKDLPTENPKGLTIGAVLKRHAAADVLISKHGKTLDELPVEANIGTSSLRRAAQLKRYRSDFKIIDIRGNVPTRINKALDYDSDYDAIVLARAGVERLGLSENITQIIPLEIMLPAPGQGAIGVQCRHDDESRQFFSRINDYQTRATVTIERNFLNQLEGGCSMPVAALATFISKDEVLFQGRVAAVDGVRMIEVEQVGKIGETINDIDFFSSSVANDAVEQGAAEILAQVKKLTHD